MWARTENQIDDAVVSARVSGVHAPPMHLAVLRKAMALHFARGTATVELLDGLWARRRPHLVGSLVQRHRKSLTTHYQARFGRLPTESELRRLVEGYTSDGTHLNETGAWTRARVEQLFALLNGVNRTPRRMELVRPSDSTAFFISDDPVTTHLHEHGEIATANRIDGTGLTKSLCHLRQTSRFVSSGTSKFALLVRCLCVRRSSLRTALHN